MSMILLGQVSWSIAWVSILLLAVVSAEDNSFQPYQLNGGLVTAVAAKDFVVIASDTRFAGDGGYDIVSRQHVESRLWMASTDAQPLSLIRRKQPPSTSAFLPRPTNPERKDQEDDEDSDHSLGVTTLRSFVLPSAPTFVGSAGCNADCEALKRHVQADLRSAIYFGECSSSSIVNTSGGGASPQAYYPPVDQVATLLSQMLFSRRGFPFYSFCIVAGMSSAADCDNDLNDSDNVGGKVYGYDAIGSYEQVAVACAGTGRELLQPILDGQFSSKLRTQIVGQGGMATTTSTTVPTQVDCTAREAIAILIDAYRSVSEREIGVGDSMVICLVERKKRGQQQDEVVECRILTAPLKTH